MVKDKWFREMNKLPKKVELQIKKIYEKANKEICDVIASYLTEKILKKYKFGVRKWVEKRKK